VKVLLDTHAFLFWMFDDPRLGDPARALLADQATVALFSAASAYEVALKHRPGKLEVARELVADLPVSLFRL